MVEKDHQPGKTETEPRREWGFKELQERVRNIYQEHDIECGYGPSTMLAKLVGNASTLEHASKNPDDFILIDRSLTNVFIWTATFANKAGLDLQDILTEKFGQGCPHCKQMPCLLTKNQDCKPTKLFYERLFETPISIDEWQKHFAEMYSNNFTGDLKKFLKFSAGKIITEIGELIGSSYRDIQQDLGSVSFNDDMKPWESEIADILAWGFATANCLHKIRNQEEDYRGYSLGAFLEEKYKDGCPYCKTPKCICKKEKTFIENLKKAEEN
jgi:thiol-disulfide isomerase/thioredoxin